MDTRATQILESLEPDEIRERLDALEREKQALRVLLRAAVAAAKRSPTRNKAVAALRTDPARVAPVS